MKNISSYSIALCMAFSVLLAAACALPGASRSTEKHSFMLRAEPYATPVAAVTARSCLSLRVNLPESAPGLNTVRMAYSMEAHRLDYYAFNEWVATPARMIAGLIETRLDASGLFAAVVSGSSDIRTDLRMDSELLLLQQDFNNGSSAVSLAVKINLVGVATRSLLESKTFSYRVPASAENAEAGVEAANHAVEQFLGDLVSTLSALIETLECPPQA
jgi:ABC-type uncharacterized transport system auxiliary subunit